MPEPSQPPPGKTLLAAAAGGFGGAVLGVVAATTMMGNGDNSNPQGALDTQESAVQVAETRIDDE